MRELKRNIEMLCAVACVSKNGYYKWLKHSDGPKKDHEDYLLVKAIFDKGKSKYGWRTIQMRLWSNEGLVMNHKKIQRIMRKYGLRAKIRRINPYRMIMKKSLEHRIFENILDRQFTQNVPLKILCTDITYLFYNQQVAYLSVVKDIATGEVVAWNLSSHIDMDLVLNTVESMKQHPMFQRTSFTDVLIHSDQGVHYTHPDYIQALKELGIVQSMSRRGNCIDNAAMETFFGHAKDDVDYAYCQTFTELHALITSYMEYYNNEREQWHRKKMTPVGYRNHLLLTAS